MTRTRLRPRGTTAAPIESDWDDEQDTCPGCNATIYGGGQCCTPHVFTAAAYATTANALDVRFKPHNAT